MTFWLDRKPTAQETGHHLAGSYSHGETIISHLAYAAAALDNETLTPEAHARAEALVKRLAEALGR